VKRFGKEDDARDKAFQAMVKIGMDFKNNKLQKHELKACFQVTVFWLSHMVLCLIFSAPCWNLKSGTGRSPFFWNAAREPVMQSYNRWDHPCGTIRYSITVPSTVFWNAARESVMQSYNRWHQPPENDRQPHRQILRRRRSSKNRGKGRAQLRQVQHLQHRQHRTTSRRKSGCLRLVWASSTPCPGARPNGSRAYLSGRYLLGCHLG